MKTFAAGVLVFAALLSIAFVCFVALLDAAARTHWHSAIFWAAGCALFAWLAKRFVLGEAKRSS